MKSFDERLPERCSRCPLIGRVAMTIREDENAQRGRTMFALRFLDRGAGAPDIAGSMVGKAYGESAMRALQRKQAYEVAKERLVSKVGDACPGRGFDPADGVIMRFFDRMNGEAICRNPEFSELANDPVIAMLLHEPLWQPAQEPPSH